ncbi:hypothetical protein, partial [Salmonella sp. SAL4360]|uniref:hypothetical protein n=1 Tax=Salmonella sp. SAL4360 TaxID=3159881 RepID=UPI00397CC726
HMDDCMSGLDEGIDLLFDDDLNATNMRQPDVANQNHPHVFVCFGSDRYHPQVTTNGRAR